MEKSGFKKLIRPDVILHVQDALAIDFDMAPLVNTTSATVSTVVDQTFVENMPLNGRNFTFLAQLSAVVTQGQQDMRGLVASESFAANGSRPVQIGKVSAR